MLVLAAHWVGATFQSPVPTPISWGGRVRPKSGDNMFIWWNKMHTFCETRCTTSVSSNQFHIHMLMHTKRQGENLDVKMLFVPEAWYCCDISVMLEFVLFCCCQWGLCNVLNVCNVCSTAVEAFSLILLLTSKTLQSGANREVKNTNKDWDI